MMLYKVLFQQYSIRTRGGSRSRIGREFRRDNHECESSAG
jgi:hypothetical protein